MSAIKRTLEDSITNVAKAANVDETMAWIAYNDMTYLGTLDAARDNAHMEGMMVDYINHRLLRKAEQI